MGRRFRGRIPFPDLRVARIEEIACKASAELIEWDVAGGREHRVRAAVQWIRRALTGRERFLRSCARAPVSLSIASETSALG
jgi:hypothetical protein